MLQALACGLHGVLCVADPDEVAPVEIMLCGAISVDAPLQQQQADPDDPSAQAGARGSQTSLPVLMASPLSSICRHSPPMSNGIIIAGK